MHFFQWKCINLGTINNIPALVQTMAWYLPGDKPLSETMAVSLLRHIYATRLNEFRILPKLLGAIELGGSAYTFVSSQSGQMSSLSYLHVHTWFPWYTCISGVQLENRSSHGKFTDQTVGAGWGRRIVKTHWGRNKMDAISQTTFSSAFS